MNIFDFENPEFGIKGVTQEEIDTLKKLCDEYGQIPYARANIKYYSYACEFNENSWLEHTILCDKIVSEILDRVKFLPDKIEHFDWWEMESK